MNPALFFGDELRWAQSLAFDEQSRPYRAALLRLKLRPAIEPNLVHHWNWLRYWSLTGERVDSLVSDLAGKPLRLRTEPVYSGPHRAVPFICFPPPNPDVWPEKLAVLGKAEKAAVIRQAAFAYAATVLDHPYPDGNGRLGRALVHGIIARRTAYHAPWLPIGPALLTDRSRAIAETIHLVRSTDWKRFVGYFASRVEFALNLVGDERERFQP